MRLFKALAILISLSLAILPSQEVYAKDDDLDKWVSKTLQPSIESNVKSFNESWEKNWNVNMSAYIIDGDKYKALEKLGKLRTDIQDSAGGVKEIKVAKQIDKEQKNKVDSIKKNLDKVFSLYDKQVEKMMKDIAKDKAVKNTKKYDKQINKTKKQLDKANATYTKLQKELKLDVKKIDFNKIAKIDKAKAKEIQADEKIKKEKNAKKKVEKEDKLRIENENKIIAELEKELADLQETHKEKTVASEKEITELKATNSSLLTEVDSLKTQVASKSTSSSDGGSSSSSSGSSGSGSSSSSASSSKSVGSVYYKNCTAARAAGAAPVHRGDPGYAKHLDRDGDGIGCE